MKSKLKINPACIAAIILLVFLTAGQTDAGRLTRAPMILPQPGPPLHSVQDSSFYKWSSPEVIKAFKDRGLEVVNLQKGLTMGSRSAKETTIFLIPSAGDNIGAMVSSYRSRKALETDTKYYAEMNRPSAPTAWRIYKRDNILLLVSGKVAEEKALSYRNSLDQL